MKYPVSERYQIEYKSHCPSDRLVEIPRESLEEATWWADIIHDRFCRRAKVRDMTTRLVVYGTEGDQGMPWDILNEDGSFEK